MAQQANMVEYNKVHSMAKSRKKVVEKFGKDLLHFWPLADSTAVFRDLTRKKPLSGFWIDTQQAGMIDYSVYLDGGRISDIGRVWGWDTDDGDNGPARNAFAVEMPAGIWAKIELEVSSSVNVDVYVALPDHVTTNIPADALSSHEDVDVSGGNVEVTFDFPIVASYDGQYWVYIRETGDSDWSQSVDLKDGDGASWREPVWHALDSGEWKPEKDLTSGKTRYGVFHPADTVDSWPSMTEFTMSAVVDVAECPGDDGTVVSLANGSEAKAYIKLKADRKIEGYFKDSSGDTYTVTSSRTVHPGFNVVTVSWEYYDDDGTDKVDVKLIINGQVDDESTATPGGSRDLFGEDLAVSIGQQLKTDGSVVSGSLLSFAHVDDVLMAERVIPDVDHWELYVSYITAAPLMQVESADTIVME